MNPLANIVCQNSPKVFIENNRLSVCVCHVCVCVTVYATVGDNSVDLITFY